MSLKLRNLVKMQKLLKILIKKVNKNMIECFKEHLFQKFKREKRKLSFVKHSQKRIKLAPFRFGT